MGNTQAVAPSAYLDDLDENLLTRAAELLQHTHVRKRTRDDDPPPPPAMFSAPSFALPRASLTDLAAGVGDEYTQAVLDAAATYLSSGGKACKPIGPVSAGSVGRKGVWLSDSSEPSTDSRAAAHGGARGGATRVSPEPSAAALVGAEKRGGGGGAIGAPRSVAFRCRHCGSTDRAHECAEPPADVAVGAAPPPLALAAGDCRLRPWTAVEDELICAGVAELGCKWSNIALRLDGRTDNAVRNRWHRLEAARAWRAGVEQRGLSAAELPGYKCGRCGQPKRGHACAYAVEGGAPPTLYAHAIDDSREVSGATRGDAPTADGRGAADAVAESAETDADEELSALFASLEPRQGESVAGLAQLMDGLLCPAQLEQIWAACAGDAGAATASSLAPPTADEAAHERAVRETLSELAAAGDWAADADFFEPPSADGAVCF